MGRQSGCARRTDGTLYCWGSNSYGQLGDGSTAASLNPVPVTALGTTVTEVDSGWFHGCARRSDRTLHCWGSNSFGQLGDGTATNRTSPVVVAALGAAVAELSLGAVVSCARRTDGTLWCWGANNSGQLGNGSVVASPCPHVLSG